MIVIGCMNKDCQSYNKAYSEESWKAEKESVASWMNA
jgi:hypothetical protein